MSEKNENQPSGPEDAEAPDEAKDEAKAKEAKAKAGAKKSQPVKARCIRACICQGAYREPGTVLFFPGDKVSPHFEVI